MDRAFPHTQQAGLRSPLNGSLAFYREDRLRSRFVTASSLDLRAAQPDGKAFQGLSECRLPERVRRLRPA
jgi:hypothetical protein